MGVTRRSVLQGLTASVGLLNMPAIVIPASADVEPPPLRGREILPDPDFSLLKSDYAFYCRYSASSSGWRLSQARR